MNKIIKPATLDDYKIIANIEFNSGYFWSRYSIKKELELSKKMLSENNYYVFLIKNENIFIGYFLINKKNYEIGMSILEKYHSKGFGSIIMDYIIKFSKENKIQKLKLNVWENNLKAINLYKKFGFKIISKKKNFYENNDSLLYMELNLKII